VTQVVLVDYSTAPVPCFAYREDGTIFVTCDLSSAPAFNVSSAAMVEQFGGTGVLQIAARGPLVCFVRGEVCLFHFQLR